MRPAIEPISLYQRSATQTRPRKLRMILADGSPQYLAAVYTVLEFHQAVDLVGRAANFEEAIKLAVDLKPDLVLIDLDMPSAKLAISAINLCSEGQTRIVGMSASDSVPPQTAELILTVTAIVPRASLRQKFLPLLNALYDIASTPSGMGLATRNVPYEHRLMENR